MKSVNLGELLWELIDTAYDVVTWIWKQDYSILTREYFGFTLIELLGIYLAFCFIRDVIKFIFTLSGKAIANIFGTILRTFLKIAWAYFLKFFRMVFSRVRITIRYLLNTPKITDWKENFKIKLEDLISYFVHTPS